MNYRVTTIMLAVTLLVVLGVSVTQAAPAERPSEVAPAGIYDFTNHGTAWVPEKRNNFSHFKPFGWGTKTSVKLKFSPSNQWVHIPVPMPSRIANDFVNVQYVEFCARSSNGAYTKPIRWDLWNDHTGRFYSSGISWPANNDRNCIGHTFSPTVWVSDLGISVLIKYANNKDAVTLYKAWVRVEPAP